MTKMLKTLAVQDSLTAARPAVPRIVGAWWSRYHAWRVRRAASLSLSSLSDFQLKDIGLHRSEIGSVVRDGSSRRRCRRH